MSKQVHSINFGFWQRLIKKNQMWGIECRGKNLPPPQIPSVVMLIKKKKKKMSVVTSAIQLCDTPSLSGLWSWSANNACGTEILFFSFFRGHPFSFLPLILLTVSQSQLTD